MLDDQNLERDLLVVLQIEPTQYGIPFLRDKELSQPIDLQSLVPWFSLEGWTHPTHRCSLTYRFPRVMTCYQYPQFVEPPLWNLTPHHSVLLMYQNLERDSLVIFQKEEIHLPVQELCNPLAFLWRRSKSAIEKGGFSKFSVLPFITLFLRNTMLFQTETKASLLKYQSLTIVRSMVYRTFKWNYKWRWMPPQRKISDCDFTHFKKSIRPWRSSPRIWHDVYPNCSVRPIWRVRPIWHK